VAKIDLKKYRKRLLDARAEIKTLSKTTAEARKPVALDQSAVGRLSRMDAIQVQAMQLETERRRGLELQRINVALKRIDSGDFGYCLVCDEAIQPKRLQNDPAALTCIDCAEAG
jgi:DnaK suppressor protein